ncbi:MAG: hypothetical protein DI537_14060 [Stutzerimonas stutzeri]|nr:MAG: hypothetical protein DI537_14060 [Stutzerimonas stutzeri]
MDRAQFLAHIDGLQNEVQEAVHAYCATHGLDLDWLDFLQGSGQDLDTFAREILFFGVGIVPEPEVRPRLASSA